MGEAIMGWFSRKKPEEEPEDVVKEEPATKVAENRVAYSTVLSNLDQANEEANDLLSQLRSLRKEAAALAGGKGD